MPINPLTLLGRDLIKAGVKDNLKIAGPKWEEYVEKVFDRMFPKEVSHLKSRARIAKGTTPEPLGIMTESRLKAMELPVIKVRRMYPETFPNRDPEFRLHVIACRLQAHVPQAHIVGMSYRRIYENKLAVQAVAAKRVSQVVSLRRLREKKAKAALGKERLQFLKIALRIAPMSHRLRKKYVAEMAALVNKGSF